MEWQRGRYTVSDERARLDLAAVHAALARSYWAAGIPRELVERSVANALSFGLYRADEGGERQVGFARVITDRATFAYLSDVFVADEERGRGLARFLLECIHAHPELADLRRWMLVTRDAQGLYERLGWRVVRAPEEVMEIVARDPYGASAAEAEPAPGAPLERADPG
jgi:GNAT superfamily N-acetyltransferase